MDYMAGQLVFLLVLAALVGGMIWAVLVMRKPRLPREDDDEFIGSPVGGVGDARVRWLSSVATHEDRRRYSHGEGRRLGLPEAAVAGSAWNGRGLRLPVPPDPEHAAELAQRAADAARNVSGIDLDYTPGSLRLVDEVLDSFREPGSDAVAETIFVFGCYVGEVLVRHAGYEWVQTPPEIARNLMPLTVFRALTGTHANPIGKAFKRVDNGADDNIPYFYQLFSEVDL